MKRDYEKVLYDLKIGEVYWDFTRVPGGWVYSGEKGICFIPYSEEFQPDQYKPELSIICYICKKEHQDTTTGGLCPSCSGHLHKRAGNYRLDKGIK